MHIPEQMLKGQICQVTAGFAAIGLASAVYFAAKSKTKPSAMKFALVAGFIFAAQMFNFPISSGTSGHLLGGVLAAAVLGTPFGILAVSIVVALQSIIFADGGLSVMGANILNMGIIGTGAAGLVYEAVKSKVKSKSGNIAALAAASWLSIMASSLACSIELGFAGTIEFSKVIPAMAGVHAQIGIVEALITVAAYSLFRSKNREQSGKLDFILPAAASVITVMMASAFASSLPDGLEWVAGKYNFLHEAAPLFVTPFADYSFAPMGESFLSTAIAGIAGMTVTVFLVYCAGKIVNMLGNKKTV